MHRKLGLILLGCFAVHGQVTGGPALNSAPNVSSICFVDGPTYTSIQSAIAGCVATGMVVIPPTYSAAESYENPNGVLVLDFRHPTRPSLLTPVTDFGANGDATIAADGVSQRGFATFSSASASFVPGRDEGKAIVITGAGDENSSLTTTITAVNSSTSITLAVAAGFAATDLTYWFGTDNTSAFQAAYKSGKPLFLPEGKYLMTGTVKGTSPLFLVGAGERSVIIDDTIVFEVRGKLGHFLDNLRLQAATRLTALPPRSFPTPHAGTPVAVDRIGAGIGYQPQSEDQDIWPKLSKQQQAQRIGPTLNIIADHSHIYRITGDLVSILLYDVQFSEVALCNFRGGRNFVGGIALWHTPKDGLVNREDKIHDNHVRYASFNGISWADSERASILHNQVEYNGESGLKNYSTQGDQTYNTYADVVGNLSLHNHYDGLDLSQTYPHTNRQQASSTVSGNTSSFNDRTGAYVDGVGWTLTNNTFEGNGLTGMSMDVTDSVISRNTLKGNNTLHQRHSHQMIVGPGTASLNNLIEYNHIAGTAAAGAAIVLSPTSAGNKLRYNSATGGAVFNFGIPPEESRGNSDSRGSYPDR